MSEKENPPVDHCTKCGTPTTEFWAWGNKGPNGFEALCKSCADELPS